MPLVRLNLAMRPAHGLSGVTCLMVASVSSTAHACGGSAMFMAQLWASLAVVWGLSILGVVSLRPATRVLRTAASVRPTTGRRIAYRVCWVAYGLAIASTVLWGALLLAGLLLV